jgi:Domain of unknown function (DUF6285)
VQDKPRPPELVNSVAEFLRASVLPVSTGRLAYDVRVAIHALEIVARELTLASASDAAEAGRLAVLLAAQGSLEHLNRLLCARLRDGSLTAATPGLIPHLWKTTLAKLAVDQPTYAAYRREKERGEPSAT